VLPRDFQKIKNLKAEINKYYSDNIAKHEAKDNILELNKHLPDFNDFMATHKTLLYLQDITARTLYKFYSNVVPRVPVKKIFALKNPISITLFS
jgi:hypothetical protein